MAREKRLGYCQDLVIKKLPHQNYAVLKYLIHFLALVRNIDHTDSFHVGHYFQVSERSDMNKMTASNLAVVFGSNLAWPRDKIITTDYVNKINIFIEYLIKNLLQVFTI